MLGHVPFSAPKSQSFLTFVLGINLEMSSRRRFDDNSSSDDSPPRPSSQRETPKTAPKTAPRSAVKATPVVTPSTNSKMYASGYKEKVDYSNSKEVHKCLEDLDNVISKRKMELSSIQRSSAISGGHRRKLARTTVSAVPPFLLFSLCGTELT